MPNYMTELSPDNDAHVYQIKDKEAAPIDLLKDTVGWVGKNKLVYPYFDKGNKLNQNGIDFYDNGNGSITVKAGTATANATYLLYGDGDTVYGDVADLVDKKLSKGIDPTGIIVACNFYSSAKSYISSVNATKDGVDITIPANAVYYVLILRVLSGTTVSSDTVVYPMLRDASILDDTYEPYHKSVEEVVEQVYADNGVLGAKNLLQYPYVNTTRTVNGITFTDNGDGSFTISGVATSTVNEQLESKILRAKWADRLKGKDVVFTGGLSSNVFVQFWRSGQGSISDTGNGLYFTFPDLSGVSDWNIAITVVNGTDLSTPITIYPMLRLASDPDDTYIPYAMTNRELTDAMQVQDILSELTIGAGVLDTESFAKKCGNQIFMSIKITGLTATAYSTGIVNIPKKYAPPKSTVIYGRIGGVGIKDLGLNVGSNSCNITCFENIENKTLTIGLVSWIID